MRPTIRYDLHEGEWVRQPPAIGWDPAAAPLAEDLQAAIRSAPWAAGESASRPAVSLDGRELPLPLDDEGVALLTRAGVPAPYGKGERTLVDLAVRNALQIPAARVSVGGPGWDGLREEAIAGIAEKMDLSGCGAIDLIPLKLLVYPPGGMFVEHADTEKSPGMVGTLSLLLPSRGHVGGALRLSFHGESVEAHPSASDRWRWVAWYADCVHELLPVSEGVRVAMTYGIAIADDAPLGPMRGGREARRTIRRMSIRTDPYATAYHWANPAPEAARRQVGKTVWPLAHRYTEQGLKAGLLKGRDRQLARIVLDDRHGREECLLGWLRASEVSWAAEAKVPDAQWGIGRDGHGSLPDGVEGAAPEEGAEEWLRDIRSIRHLDTPTLAADGLSAQHVWIEGLRELDGAPARFGALAVLPGEAMPTIASLPEDAQTARVFENTGNEGASIELQYRCAALVAWDGPEGSWNASLSALALSGGRRALAVEVRRQMRFAESPVAFGLALGFSHAMSLWGAALLHDGGEPAPEAHRGVIEAIDAASGIDDPSLHGAGDDYVAHALSADPDPEAARFIERWLRNDGGRLSLLTGDAREALLVRSLPPFARPGSDGGAALLQALRANEGIDAKVRDRLPDPMESSPFRER